MIPLTPKLLCLIPQELMITARNVYQLAEAVLKHSTDVSVGHLFICSASASWDAGAGLSPGRRDTPARPLRGLCKESSFNPQPQCGGGLFGFHCASGPASGRRTCLESKPSSCPARPLPLSASCRGSWATVCILTRLPTFSGVDFWI